MTILVEALPIGVKVTNLDEFDGTGISQEHLDKFYTNVNLYDLSDAALCKVFKTTLSKRALTWFNQVSVRTIIGLEQPKSSFISSPSIVNT